MFWNFLILFKNIRCPAAESVILTLPNRVLLRRDDQSTCANLGGLFESSGISPSSVNNSLSCYLQLEFKNHQILFTSHTILTPHTISASRWTLAQLLRTQSIRQNHIAKARNDLRFRVRRSIYSDESDGMEKLRFREQRFMRAISGRFRRMNEDNIQKSNNRRIESTSSLFTTTRRMNHTAWEKDDCKITSWRTTKRDENALNRRRDTEMYVNWKFHLLSHWTSSWDEFWSQIGELFMTSKATTVNLISIFKILSNPAKFIQKTVITHITSFNPFTPAKSTRKTARWTIRWTTEWTIIETINFLITFIRKSVNRQTITLHHWKFRAPEWTISWIVRWIARWTTRWILSWIVRWAPSWIIRWAISWTVI